MPKRALARNSDFKRHAVDAHCGVRTLIATFERHNPTSVGCMRGIVAEELYSIPNMDTPFGTMTSTMQIPTDYGFLEVYHASPIACMYHALSKSQLFVELMCSTREAGSHTVVLYMDEATPSNQKRPDRGRCNQCIYFSLLEWPCWFRSKKCGWVPFAYVYTQDLVDHALSDSKLLRWVLHIFKNDVDINAEFAVIVDTNMGHEVFRFNTKLTCCDWPQHKKNFSLKGHSGICCCYFCPNCIGHCDEFDDDYLVHFSSTEYHRFQRHTSQSWLDLANDLEDTAINHPAQLGMKEKSYGLKYEPESLMWDHEARLRLALPYAAYVDWMHTWVASGGVAQYQVNQMVQVLSGLF